MSSCSYYTLLPFLTVWLIDHRHVGGVDAATVLGAAILATRAGSALLPPLLGRFMTRDIVMTANTVAVGLILSLWAYPGRRTAVFVLIVASLGLALSAATLAMKALVATSYPAAQRLQGYSLLNLAVNAGSGTGPVIGGAVTAMAPAGLPLVAAGLEALSVVAALGLPSAGARPAGERPVRRLRRCLPPPAFLAFVAATSLTWVAYAQLFAVFPLYATDAGSPGLASAMFAVNAALVVVLQMPVSRWVAGGEEHLCSSAGRVVGSANLALAGGVALLAVAVGRWWFLAVVGVVLFTLAELVWSPSYDALVPDFAAPLEPMVGFGLAALGWGLAESLGAAVGTALVAHGAPSWPGALAFLVGAAAAIVAAGAVGVLGALRPDPSPTSARPVEAGP